MMFDFGIVRVGDGLNEPLYPGGSTRVYVRIEQPKEPNSSRARSVDWYPNGGLGMGYIEGVRFIETNVPQAESPPHYCAGCSEEDYVCEQFLPCEGCDCPFSLAG